LRHQIELFGVAFREDKVMIEAQQALINRSPDRLMMRLSFAGRSVISPAGGGADGLLSEAAVGLTCFCISISLEIWKRWLS